MMDWIIRTLLGLLVIGPLLHWISGLGGDGKPMSWLMAEAIGVITTWGVSVLIIDLDGDW